MSFIDTAFCSGNAATTGTLMRVRDSYGSTRDRRYDRRSVKRATARNVRKHIADELLNRS